MPAQWHEPRGSKRAFSAGFTHPEELRIGGELPIFDIDLLHHEHTASEILELRFAERSDAFRQHRKLQTGQELA